MKSLAVFIALTMLSVAVHGLDKPRKYKEKSPTYPLSQVITATEQALNDYQTFVTSSGNTDGLPPLATADFDFKTVVDTKVTGGVNLYIITIGASYEKQDTNEIDFQYQPHVQKLVEYFDLDGTKAPKTLYQQLIDTMKESAKAIKNESEQQGSEANQLDFCQLSMAISFGVTTDVQVGIKAPIELVTISATLDHSKNNVQQVKLLFKVKDPTGKKCATPKTTN